MQLLLGTRLDFQLFAVFVFLVIEANVQSSAVKGFPNACEFEFELIQHSLCKSQLFQVSELDGLNLNVTIPNFDGNRLEKQGKLPVFVFIHGGNFQGGSSDYPQYDQTRIVKLSSDIGLPIIGVTFKYVIPFSTNILVLTTNLQL